MTNILLVATLLSLVVMAYFVDKLWRTMANTAVVVGYIYLYLDNLHEDFGPELENTEKES